MNILKKISKIKIIIIKLQRRINLEVTLQKDLKEKLEDENSTPKSRKLWRRNSILLEYRNIS